MNDYADDRCPRCDSAECHSAGAYNGVVVANVPFCAGPPVDWRGRALEAETAFRAGELAAQAGDLMDGVRGHWQTRGYAHASRLLRAIEAEALAARLRAALEVAGGHLVSIYNCMGGVDPDDWNSPENVWGYAREALVAMGAPVDDEAALEVWSAEALLAAAKGGSDGR